MKAETVRINGTLKIKINGIIYEPLAFKTFRAEEGNISRFYKAGMRLFNVLTGSIKCMIGVPYSLFGETWIGDREYDFGPIDRQLDLFMENAPEGYFSVMLQLDTRPWYCEKHGVPYSFEYLSQALVCEKWQDDAEAYLRAAVEHIEAEYGDRVFGYFLLCGMTTEWFSEHDYEEATDEKTAAYRRYLGDPDAVIPSKSRREPTGEKVFLDPTDDADIISYRRFHSELISKAICRCAAVVKEITDRNKLVGVYYGYLYELGGARLWNTGGLDYERVFLSDDIDMISSPSSYSYGQREFDGASGVMVTAETLSRHNKLYFLEFDHRTYTAPKYIDGSNGIPLPGYESRLPTLQATVDVMRRDYMLCLTQRMAMWWFDMFGGWFDPAPVMDEISSLLTTAVELDGLDMSSCAEICVISDGGESLYHINKNADVNTSNLSEQLVALTKIGAPIDLYSRCDLGIIDVDKYKLFVFTDLFAVDGETAAFIKDKICADDRTVLYLTAPGIVSDGIISPDNVTDLTGVGIGGIEVRANNTEYNGISFGYKSRRETLSVNDPDTEMLCLFDDGAPAVIKKYFENHTAVLSAGGGVPTILLRDIAREAGVHIYSDDRPVYVNRSLVGVYLADGEDTVLNVPDGEYCDVFSDEIMYAQNGKLTVKYRGSRAVLLERLTPQIIPAK